MQYALWGIPTTAVQTLNWNILPPRILLTQLSDPPTKPAPTCPFPICQNRGAGRAPLVCLGLQPQFLRPKSCGTDEEPMQKVEDFQLFPIIPRMRHEMVQAAHTGG